VSNNECKIKHIFFAEDDEDDQFIFCQLINEINPGIKVDLISNGLELMNLLSHFSPDLLFLDLNMPIKNGLECLVAIRGNPALAHLPVIVFSATTRHANIQAAYEVGAHLFVIKSNTFDDAAASLRSILKLNWNDPEAIKDQYYINGRFTAFL